MVMSEMGISIRVPIPTTRCEDDFYLANTYMTHRDKDVVPSVMNQDDARHCSPHGRILDVLWVMGMRGG